MILENKDQIKFIEDLCNNICKGYQYKAVLFGGSLYILAEDTIFYYMNLESKIDPNFKYAFFSSGLNKSFMDENNTINVIHKYYELRSQMYNKVYENLSIMEDEKFNEYINVKTTDGANFFFVHTNNGKSPFIPIFNGLPNLNKNDTVTLELFNVIDNVYLVKMNIFKKKYNLSYELIYRILDVNRPLR